MALHPDVARLAETLEAMTFLLKRHGNNEWAEQIDRCRMNVARSDYYGVEQLLRLYGGMGSLNDVVLQAGGIAKAGDNEKFEALRSSAWEQSQTLARDEAGRSGG